VSVIVDASVVVALVVADERQAAARAQLEEWMEVGEDLHAPAVLSYEVAN
jgi:predicted nucleic acid-binding protein